MTDEPELRSAPVDGVPSIDSTPSELSAAGDRIAAGHGPIAMDAERASGFRYSQRAYLIQVRREGTGTVLIDPIPEPDAVSALAPVLGDSLWILHSADQDLPCLDELGLRPAELFDTELAGRLCGFERVGLAAICEHTLGVTLAKGHGAADWSRRPLPEDWVNYAALDVELLLALHEAMVSELAAQDKTEWARQEFEYIRTRGPAAPKLDRWRRTSGIHKLRSPRQLAAVRELWLTRDEYARDRDIAPGRVLPDAAIIAAATAAPRSLNDLTALPVFSGPRQRRHARRWFAALTAARALTDAELPNSSNNTGALPPVSRWERRDPEAAARITAARDVLADLSEKHRVPVENLLTPETLRRLAWDWRPSTDVEQYLLDAGARPWQRELATPLLEQALATAARS